MGSSADPSQDPVADPAAISWGRVDDDGRVFVRSRQGDERQVGQWPDADSSEALAFYRRRFDGLEAQVALLERRATSGAVAPAETKTAAQRLSKAVHEAAAVGDLASLQERLAALDPVVEHQREARRADRAKRTARAARDKEKVVAAAEQVATGDDWRSGHDRLTSLLSEWKALPRLDKPADDALWRRFSAARTAYSKRRKQHLADRDQQRKQAESTKQRLAKEAESLADSTDWVATGRRFRDLMQAWKAAGPASRAVDDALWKRFRTAQDHFFGARDQVEAAGRAEQSANAEVKRAILREAEALLPVADVAAARTSLRPLAERWEAAGRVPRELVRSLEGRMRAVEDAINVAEAERWKRSDPEAQARAAGMVEQLVSSLTRLHRDQEAARAKGDTQAVDRLQEQIDVRQGWLDQAQRSLSDFRRVT